MTSRDVAAARMKFPAEPEQALQNEKISIKVLTMSTLIGFLLGVVYCYVFYLDAVSRALVHNQGESFLIVSGEGGLRSVSSAGMQVSALLSFDSTTKVVRVDTGAELPMHTARTRTVSREILDGRPMLRVMDKVMLLGLVELEEQDQGYRDIPSREYLDAEDRFLQAKAELAR